MHANGSAPSVLATRKNPNLHVHAPTDAEAGGETDSGGHREHSDSA